MTWYDFLFIAFVAGYGIVGYLSGFIKSITGVVGVVVASWISGISYSSLALSLMKGNAGLSQEMAKVQAYGTMWIASYIGFVIISTLLINAFRGGNTPKTPSRSAGALIGLFKAVFILTLLMILIFDYTPKELASLKDSVQANSKTYPMLKPLMEPVKSVVYALMSTQWTTELQLPPDMLQNIEKQMKEKVQ